jgi:3-oxoacyl-[acyl-carrier protein] reductase
MRLQGKAALVTGGGTGMGKAISLKFASEGADVVINYSRRQEAAEETAAAARAQGVKAYVIRADVSKDAEARRLVAEAAAQLGRLDILVNNAGWSRYVPHRDLEALTEEILQRTLAVNTLGPLYVSRAAIPVMLKQGGGRIINITSVSAYHGAGSSVIYGASKGALVTLSKSMARSFGRDNIQINMIAPGLVDTNFVDWPKEALEKGTKTNPMGRLPTPEDIANAALFLAADSTGITAQTIFCDGGLMALHPVG